MRFRSLLILSLSALAGLGACDDPTGLEDGVDETDLIFIRTTEDAPPLANTTVTFWAVPDEDRTVKISYLATGPYPAGDCLTFTVPAGAITGPDSVQITIEVVDPKQFHFEFSPAGLDFSEENPARLEVNYLWADQDFDGDGDEDAADEAIAASFGFWRQETPGSQWFDVSTEKFVGGPLAVTEITGFTRYALASN